MKLGVARRAGRSAIVVLPLAGGLFLACSNSSTPAGELLVAVDTNVALPQNVDNVEIDVTDQNGKVYTPTTFALPGNANPGSLPIRTLPGTLGIVPGASAGEQISVRLIGRLGPTAVFVRDSQAVVPNDHIGVLRIVIDGLCLGSSSVTTAADGTVGSTCTTPAAVQTCIAGACVSDEVSNVEALDPTGPYGDGSQGTCFDAKACFQTSSMGERALVPVTRSTNANSEIVCTIPVPQVIDPATGVSQLAPVDQLNIAVPVAASLCAGGESPCLIPLDGYDVVEDPAEGWAVSGTMINLPLGICAPSNGAAPIAAVLVSTSCARKTSDNPLCGAWDRVTTPEPTADGGILASSLDASTGGGMSTGGDASTIAESDGGVVIFEDGGESFGDDASVTEIDASTGGVGGSDASTITGSDSGITDSGLKMIGFDASAVTPKLPGSGNR